MWQEVVLDAAPLLDSEYVLPSNTSNEPLTFYTIPEVLAEIKDEQSRQRLERFKAVHTLNIAQPTQEAVQTVMQFAKRSGDLQVLSRADLRLIALTVTRMQAHGIPTRPLPSGAQVHQGATLPKQTEPQKEEKQKSLTQEMAAEMPSAPTFAKRVSELDRISECEEPAASLSETEEMDNALAAALEECHIVEEESGQVDHIEPEEDPSNMEADGFVKVSHRKQNKRMPMRQMAPEEGWITPDNLDKMKTRHASVKNAPKVKEAEEVVQHPVVVITGDFAMQNILLQLGAHLLAKDGQRITQIRQYVLRCHACTKITKQMDKQFCPSCGNPTLMRTSCSVNEDGSLHLYLKKGFQYHLRGTKFNIAQIKGGPNASVPILREDQKEYEQAARIANRVRKDMLQAEEDPSLFGGEHYRGKLYAQKGIQSKVNLKTGRVIIGSGSRDPNRRRRKEDDLHERVQKSAARQVFGQQKKFENMLSVQRCPAPPSHASWSEHVHTIGLQLSLHQFAAPEASTYDRRQRWFDVPSCWTVKMLERWLCHCFAMPSETAALRLASGLQLREEELHLSLQSLSEQRRMPVLTLALTLRLNGGKGGFGANLRSAGGRMQSRKPNEQNISACRDLSGRRLRTVNEATELASFLAKEGDRKKALEKKVEQKLAESKRILENSGREGNKRKFTDNQFWEDKEKLIDETRAAVAEALKTSKHVASADPIAVAPSNKKLKSTVKATEAIKVNKSETKKAPSGGGLSSHWGGDEDASSSEEE